MNRLKLLAAVALLGIVACGEETVPPPVGSIVGQVSIEGTGIDGVSVNLSNGSSTTTSGGGSFRFDNVDGGSYTVTISGYPSDATFDATSAAATISESSQSVTVNFSGAYIRTASVMGTVTVENTGLAGVTVRLSGVSDATATTDAAGQYAFTGLRMGNYSVEISGFDSDEVGFSSTAAAVTVGVGESKIVPPFDGTYLRTASIQGQVSVEGVGLAGVTVSLSGGPDGVSETATTDAGGLYTFASLRAGDYAVAISGYDTGDYEFEVTSQSVTVALAQTATVPFEGTLLRTSGISGRVSVEGEGLAGVTVTLSAAEMEDMTAETDASGQYAFAGLAAGTYTVAISGYDTGDYEFGTISQGVTVALDETETVSFDATYLRTAGIQGRVDIEGEALPGVTVILTGGPDGVGETAETNDDGEYAFSGLRAGDYAVAILGYDSGDYEFGTTSQDVTVALGTTMQVGFHGTYLRTAGISGTVTVEGEALPDVTVSLTGGPDGVGETATTDADGMYAFSGLRAGDYAVAISGYGDHEFETTSQGATVVLDETETVSFDGLHLRTASISGTVTVEGEALPGVTVILTGGPDGVGETAETNDDGEYAFSGLRAGDYAVAISGYDSGDYEFGTTSQDVTVALGTTMQVGFHGTYLRTAGISGTVTVEGEALPDVTVSLTGGPDGVGETATTDADGMYAFSGLRAGDYAVAISGYGDHEFETTSQGATVVLDETETVSFDGLHLRTASISGTVTVEGEALPDVTVSLTGGPDGVGETATTDADGMYAFSGLRAGDYAVAISGFGDHEFETTSQEVTVALSDMGDASFDGGYVRTASISGTVTVEGEALPDVTVSLTGGPDGVGETATTDADGNYGFTGLRAGDYTVAISGYDTGEYEFATTSQDVTVALGEMKNASFDGARQRTSGITGRVSADGEALEGVTVTLSGEDMEDMTETTDAAGHYVFTGLLAGTYTVAISDYEEAAYVFGETSKEAMVADDETEIVNFEGEHATTASVSGMLFVDEAERDSLYNEGEDPFPAALVPLFLVGPGVDDQLPSATNEQGQFAFTNLRKGTYQLVVGITPEVEELLGDYAYGGPTTGYQIDLDVGQDMAQNIPFYITHQTVDFSVSLRSGDETGEALPGATVTLYKDMGGEDMVEEGMGMTGDDGMVSIRFARDETSGSTVYAAVASDDYHAADEMQTVTWNPKYPKSEPVANEADIVNLNVDVTFGGVTITTDYGGGDPLAGWEVSVMTGEDAVEGAPEELDDDGMASFSATVEADDLPVTYTFALADAQDNDLDGGESFEADPVEYMHDGLSLAATMDAGTIEARYTTQTLMVYVHHEMDQVHGYTGNILGGDTRMSGMVDLKLRYIDETGRSRSFTSTQWNESKNTSDKDGVTTFTGLPADANIIVQAEEAEEDADGNPLNIMVLHPDELATYRNLDDNGVTGGAFGAMGGFSHTVELCPLTAVDPTSQDHGECGSFAFVNMHSVSGTITKNMVEMSDGADGFDSTEVVGVPGITFGMDPVEGKNLAGESASFITLASNDRTTDADDRTAFSFGRMAAGVYSVSVPSGWSSSIGEVHTLDADITDIVVTPTTTLVYGYVRNANGHILEGATVTVNGQETMTDSYGRYLVDDVEDVGGKISVVGSLEGFEGKPVSEDFEANAPTKIDIELAGATETATISGTARMANGDPVAGVEILADGAAPLNHATRGDNEGKLVTDADGNFTALIEARSAGTTVEMSAMKEGISFQPAVHTTTAIAGSEITGVAFTGFANATITGRVIAPSGGPMSDVKVEAMQDGSSVTEDMTGSTGVFRLSVSTVPNGTYTIQASIADRADIMFAYPNDSQVAAVIPGGSLSFGDIQAKSWAASSIEVERTDMTSATSTLMTTNGTVTWDAGTAQDGVTVMQRAEISSDGQTWVVLDVAKDQSSADSDNKLMADGEVPAGAFSVRVVSSDGNFDPADNNVEGEPVEVDPIDVTPEGVTAARTSEPDAISIEWEAVTVSMAGIRQNVATEQRVVIEVDIGGSAMWLVAATLDETARSHSVAIGTYSWPSLDGELTASVTAEHLEKALRIRVDARLTADDDWSEGNVAEVDPVP